MGLRQGETAPTVHGDAGYSPGMAVDHGRGILAFCASLYSLSMLLVVDALAKPGTYCP